VTEPTSDRTAGGAVADSDAVRDALIGAVIDFLSGQDLLTQQDIRTALAHEIACAGRGALLDLRERLRMDAGWGYYPPDPLARRIHHVLADRFLRADSLVTGGVTRGLTGQPVLSPSGIASDFTQAGVSAVQVLDPASDKIIAENLLGLPSDWRNRYSTGRFAIALDCLAAGEMDLGPELQLLEHDVRETARKLDNKVAGVTIGGREIWHG